MILRQNKGVASHLPLEEHLRADVQQGGVGQCLRHHDVGLFMNITRLAEAAPVGMSPPSRCPRPT